MLELNYKGQDLLKHFNLQDALEIYFALHELKPVTRLVISESKLKELNDICSKLGLNFVCGSFKILNRTCIIDKEADVTGSYFVYFSKDEDSANITKKAEENFEDDIVGKMFGYPSCCREFYRNNYAEAKKYGNDFAPITHRETTHFHYLTNNLLRNFGYFFISHFPCKHNCMESVKYAKEASKILEKENPALAFEIRKRLRGPVFYHKDTGVLAFDQNQEKENRFWYKKPFLIHACDVYNAFNSGNNLIIGKKIVKIFKDDRLVKEYDQEELLTYVFK